MTRLIDADEFLRSEIKRCGCGPFIGTCTSDNEVFKFVLERQPTVDAVEIVRCKDCKYRGFSECTMCHEEWYDYDDDGYLESDIRVYDYTEDDGFCHKGEREDDSI